MEKWHLPVLLEETIENMNVFDGGVYFDGTFGEGGHTEAILERGGQVWATDRDAGALKRYQADGRLRSHPHLHLIYGEFSKKIPDGPFDGALLDLGVSTRQLLEGERGFSFKNSGPLDMRMDPGHGRPLAEMLDDIGVDELAAQLRRNVDLRGAHRVARRILEAHGAGKLQTTGDLAALFPVRGPKHPATPIFLGLRMWVNREWEQVEEAVPQILDRLKPGGRLAVITFHSSEDRLVKHLFRRLAGREPVDGPEALIPQVQYVRPITRRPIEPSKDELAHNPRARSAKLRCVEKVPPTG